MNRFFLLTVLLWVPSCTKQSQTMVPAEGKPAAASPAPAAAMPAAALPAATPAATPDDDCTLATKLVEGIPGSPGHLIKSARNPNGDSEFAVLMRQFVDDLREVRQAAESKQSVKKLYPTHRKMRCSWPTKPEERNEKFDGLAQGYLAAVRAFDASPQQASYNAIIQGCIGCHSVSCGGPLEFIDTMKWQ